MSQFRVDVHRFDQEGANWEATELRMTDRGLMPLWHVIEHFGGNLTTTHMERLHDAIQYAEQHGRGHVGLESKNRRGYDITFTKL